MREVRLVATKWGGLPHWENDALLLGRDEHGTWLGVPVGTLMSRPGVEFRTDVPQVVCVPERAAHVASFYAPGGRLPCDVYVDVTTPPVWDGPVVTAVDLDLDVLRGWGGRVWVDDEQEFAEHRRLLGYPDDVVALATASCAAVLADVTAGRPPFDRVAPQPWFEALARGTMAP